MKTLLSVLLLLFIFPFVSSAQDQRCSHVNDDKLQALSDHLDLDPEYHTRQEVYDFLDSIIPLYPEIAMLDTSWGSQFQGFKIPVVKISDNPGIEEDEPAIGYDGLIHSREPVSMETCLKLIEYLLTNYATDPLVKTWIDNTEIFIMPMLNPDGWVYVCANWASHNMWYKNQHDNDSNGLFHPFYRIRCATANLILDIVNKEKKDFLINLLSEVLKNEKTEAAKSSIENSMNLLKE